MATVHYGCTALLGTNKAGVLKPDEHGRYDMVLGALEYPNSVGDIYTLKSAQEFFKPGSSLMRRVGKGQLRAEYGHPKKQVGQSDNEYLTRILTIEETMVCAHISDIYIDFDGVRDPETGNKIIAIRGKVRPAGPYGSVLKDALDDPKQNVAFSIRSLTLNKQVGYRQHKDFTQIVTWDYVNEPGLAPANKYSVPTLESHAIDFETIQALAKNEQNLISTESANLLTELLEHLQPAYKSRANW